MSLPLRTFSLLTVVLSAALVLSCGRSSVVPRGGGSGAGPAEGGAVGGGVDAGTVGIDAGTGYVTGAGAVAGLRAGFEDYFSAECDHEVRCGVMAAHDSCMDFVTRSDLRALEASLADARIELSEGRLAECVQLLSSTGSCDRADAAFAPCMDFLRGRQATGDVCYGIVDCVASDFCNLGGMCPGTCAKRSGVGEAAFPAECEGGLVIVGGRCALPVPVGQSCAPAEGTVNSDPCASGGFCNAAQVCSALAGEGAACSTDLPCAPDLDCVNSVCVPRGGMGSACGAGHSCQMGLVCFDSACAPFGGLGAPCKVDGYTCLRDLSCDPGSQPGEGTCEKPRVAGGDCFSVYDCAQNHRCEGAVYPAQPGTCVLLKSTGEACTDTEQCAAGTWCDGTCKPQKPLGAACAESEECGWKLHCSANTCQLKMCEDVTP